MSKFNEFLEKNKNKIIAGASFTSCLAFFATGMGLAIPGDTKDIEKSLVFDYAQVVESVEFQEWYDEQVLKIDIMQQMGTFSKLEIDKENAIANLLTLESVGKNIDSINFSNDVDKQCAENIKNGIEEIDRIRDRKATGVGIAFGGGTPALIGGFYHMGLDSCGIKDDKEM